MAAANSSLAASFGRRCSINDASCRATSPPPLGLTFRAASANVAIWLSMTMKVGASRRCVSALVRNTSRRNVATLSLIASRRATAFSSATTLAVSDNTNGSNLGQGMTLGPIRLQVAQRFVQASDFCRELSLDFRPVAVGRRPPQAPALRQSCVRQNAKAQVRSGSAERVHRPFRAARQPAGRRRSLPRRPAPRSR